MPVNLSTADLNLGKITLKEVKSKIDEVIISAQKNTKASNIDKREYSPSQLLNSQNASAAELINALPSMNMGNEGNNLSFRGDENVAIMINGKMTSLTGDNLSQIPANSIEKIEVISVPNSKYNSEGSAGVINIVLKNAKSNFNGGYVLGSAGNNNKYNGQIGYNWSLGKLSLASSYNYTYNEFENSGFSRRNYYNNINLNNYGHSSAGERIKRLHNLRLGIDYQLSERTIISLLGNISKDWGSSYSSDMDTFRDVKGLEYSLWNLQNEEEDINALYDVNLSFSHTLKNQRDKFSIEFSRSDNMNDKTTSYQRLFSIYEGISAPYQNQYSVQNVQRRPITAIQADYAMNLSTKHNFESGIRASNRDFRFTNLYTDLTTGSTVVPEFTNDFNYFENVFSMYGLLSTNWSERWISKLGVRMEQSNTESFNLDSSLYKYNYFNAFPSAILKHTLGKKAGSISASYSMRINRPGPGMLNPLQDIADPISKRYGNPTLKPEIINSFELAYGNDIAKFLSFSSSLYYKISNNAITRYLSPQSDGTFKVSIDNIGSSTFSGWEVISNFKLSKTTSMTFSSNLAYTQFTYSNLGINYERNYLNWQSRGILNFKLPWNIDGQLIAFYKSPMQSPQGEIDFMSNIDFSVRKKILGTKGMITLSVFDILNDTKFQIYASDASFDNLFNRKRETRYATIAFRYNFGAEPSNKKPKIEKQENREGGGDVGM